MSQESSDNLLKNLKCAKCKGSLIDPVQLRACLHILCKKCITELEAAFFNNINCPECGKENAKPSILNRISGIEYEVPSNMEGSSVACDFEPTHEFAMWNCFLCAKNLCRQCRGSHPLDHGDSISLLAPSRQIKLNVENLDATASASLRRDETDGSLCSALGLPESIWQECPICKSTSCPHIEVLEILHTQPVVADACCEISHHRDCNDQPLPKNYFCCKCWIPICGDCSQKGEHKGHKSRDMVNMKDYLKLTTFDLRERVSMLSAKIARDVEDQREVEQGLRRHVDLVSKAMNRRKCKVLEEVTRFFNKAMDDAEFQGKDVMRVYSNELDQTNALSNFLNALSDALNIEVDEQLNTPQYVLLLNNLEKAGAVVDEIVKVVEDRPRPQEHRLVLCGLDMFTPCLQTNAPVGRECRQPPLSFNFRLNNEISLVHSIVVKGSDQCFLSCSMTLERKYDAILHYQGENSHPKETVIDIERGRYYIARMLSGEIVASYSSSVLNAMKYFESDELLLEMEDVTDFDNTTQLQFEPRGIAATKQNTILLCVAVPQDKKGHAVKTIPGTANTTSFLMLMSLQGKVLVEAEHRTSEELSPNCVAVSDSGEICICDPKNSTLAILDSNLQLKERIKFPHPTAMTSDILSFLSRAQARESDIVFRPEGVCYDRYGRIIVADSNTDMVVRLSRSVDDHQYDMEPLICRADSPELQHFRFPKLVAIGEDGRLWVVCQEYVFVFDYGI